MNDVKLSGDVKRATELTAFLEYACLPRPVEVGVGVGTARVVMQSRAKGRMVASFLKLAELTSVVWPEVTGQWAVEFSW